MEWRLGGVQGVSSGVLRTLMSEAGTREQLLAAFSTPEGFASWLGLRPDNRISGGNALEKQADSLGFTLQPVAV